MPLRPSLTRAGGFSLIELVVSVAIIGLLASIAMPVVELTQKRQRESELRDALSSIRHAIDAYKAAADAHRVAVANGASGYPPQLSDLDAGVTDVNNPDGPKLYFLRRVPRDPMNSDTTVSAYNSWGLRSFASPPDAPQPGNDVFDVYSTSAETGLNGIAYAEW